MKSLMSRLSRFARKEDGTVLVEGVMMLPLLLWTCFGLFVFWDAHRSINTVQKASYTISDIISRRQAAVTPTYLTGLNGVMNYLLDNNQTSKMRVTSIVRSGVNNRFEVQWSFSPGSAMTPWTTSTLQTVQSRIPTMTNGDTVILLETAVDYDVNFDVGFDGMTIRQFIITRPRMAPQIGFTN